MKNALLIAFIPRWSEVMEQVGICSLLQARQCVMMRLKCHFY